MIDDLLIRNKLWSQEKTAKQANLIHPTDLNMLSVVEFAVNQLSVKHTSSYAATMDAAASVRR